MISLNDTHPAPKPVESYRVRKEAMDAAVFVIGPHARHGFEYETSKVDGRWIWRYTDEVRPDTPAEVKTNGGKKSLMLASTPMAHVGTAKPVKLPVPPRRMAPPAPWKPAGAPDGGAGGEQPPSDEMPPLTAPEAWTTEERVALGESVPACNGLDVAPQHELDSMRKTEGNLDPLALPDFLKRKPAPAKSGTYDEMKSAGALRSEPVAKPVGKPPVSRKAAKAKTAPKAAKRASKAPAKTAGASGGNRYDWKGAAEAAKTGKMPKAPDFSAATHERFRPLLAEVIQAAKSGDSAALRKITINPISSSPKAIAKFRDLCLLALKG